MAHPSPVLLVACFALIGRTVSDRDVSHDPHFLVGYRPGGVYELVRPVPLLRTGPSGRRRLRFAAAQRAARLLRAE
jgi:hypothetical protein